MKPAHTGPVCRPIMAQPHACKSEGETTPNIQQKQFDDLCGNFVENPILHQSLVTSFQQGI